jgi:hypothetical protein
MRVPTDLWIKAHLRRLTGEGVYAALVRKGDADYGTVWINVARGDGTAEVYGPAPQALSAETSERRFLRMHKAATIADAEADARLQRARNDDPDLWILEIEDPRGRHGLDDVLDEA